MPVSPISLITDPIARTTLADNTAQKLLFSANASLVTIKVEKGETSSLLVAHPKQTLTAGTSTITINYFTVEPGESCEFDVLSLAQIAPPSDGKGIPGSFLWVAAEDAGGMTFCAKVITARVRS